MQIHLKIKYDLKVCRIKQDFTDSTKNSREKQTRKGINSFRKKDEDMKSTSQTISSPITNTADKSQIQYSAKERHNGNS